MPKIVAFRGRLAITASSRLDNVDFFNVEKFVYGESVGELLDRMVDESVVLANEVKAFVRKELPVGYKMAGDYWYVNYSHVNLLEDVEIGEFTDSGGGSSVNDAKSIVLTVTHMRNSAISYALISLNGVRERMGFTEFEKAGPFTGMHKLRDLKEIALAGNLGSVFDQHLAESMKDGSLARYRKELERMRFFHELRRKERVKIANRKRALAENKSKFFLFRR